MQVYIEVYKNAHKTPISYRLSREYRMVRNRYSRLLFTSEDRLCANVREQEQSMNITSQYQYSHVCLTSRINCGDDTMLSQKIPSLGTMAKSAIGNYF